MSFVPSHKIYASDGSTLLYTIENVIKREPLLSQEVSDFVELTNLRSQGSIIISGGSQPYNISIYGLLREANYTSLMTAWNTIKTTIATKTQYVLKIDTSLTTTEDIKVMRLEPIIHDSSRGNVVKNLFFTLILRANTWN